MLHHYLIAALRNLAANRLQSAVAILGLSVGIAAAILAGLVVRNQTTYDHFIPGYGRTYLHIHAYMPADAPPQYYFDDDPAFAAAIKLASPEIEAISRLCEDRKAFHHGNVTADEHLYWADPNMFDVLPLPVVTGDVKTALQRPDGIVLTRGAANKYFGRTDILGQTIAIEGQPKIVRAVIEDLPARGSELNAGHKSCCENVAAGGATMAFASGCTVPQNGERLTYLRLKPGMDIAPVQERSSAIYHRLPGWGSNTNYQWWWIPIDRINLHEGLYPGVTGRLVATALAGALVLLIAIINFVNLMTARAGRRAIEVGVRKSFGAARHDLMAQFLTEALLITLLAAVIGLALVEWLLAPVNAFLMIDASPDYWRYPGAFVALAAGIGLTGLAAGAYPALILSAFRPAMVLKGMTARLSGPAKIRSVLVMLQYAILIALIIATAVFYRQRLFATQEAMRASVDRILVVQAPCSAFRDQTRQLPGVRADFCSDRLFLSPPMSPDWIVRDGRRVPLSILRNDPGVFAILGLKPLAGSLREGSGGTAIAINDTARRRLGFVSAEAALGQLLMFPDGAEKGAPPVPHTITAVMPDFSLYSVETPVQAAIFAPLQQLSDPYLWPHLFNIIRLDGDKIPETLAAIDDLRSRIVYPGAQPGRNGALPPERYFLDAHIQALYDDMLRQMQILGALAGMAIALACLGLFGLSVDAAQRRTKEMGIRKALGCSNRAIVGLMRWQVARPVLWANLIAWPLAGWAMTRWLNGFAYHVPLDWWLFPAAGGAALVVALATVAGQAWQVARRAPVTALRYE
jgi:putative ABC transport system permease protein